MRARTTASGVLPPANSVAAPSDRAVATAGAMWVMDWNRTSVSPIAPRSSPGSAGSAGTYVAAIASTSARVAGAGACVAVAREWCILGRPSRPAIGPADMRAATAPSR